jgi:hypothetical protein
MQGGRFRLRAQGKQARFGETAPHTRNVNRRV